MRASLGGYRLSRKLRRVGKACLAATIEERSNLDAGLEDRVVPPRDWRLWAIEPSAAKA
jgi:hypothetical protein